MRVQPPTPAHALLYAITVRHFAARVDVAMTVRVVRVGGDGGVVVRAEVVPDLVREAQVSAGAAAVHDREGARRARIEVAQTAVRAVFDEQADDVRAVGVAPGVHLVHLAVDGAGQAVEEVVEREPGFAVAHLRGVDEAQARHDAAVGVGEVRAVDRLLDLRGDAGTRRRGRLVRVDDHHVDRAAGVGGRDVGVLRRLQRASACRASGALRRERRGLAAGRMVGRKAGRVELAQPHGSTGIGDQLVGRGSSRALVDDDDRTGDVTVHDREHGVAAREAAHAPVPRVVAGRARLDAHALQRHDHAVEELDAEFRRRGRARVEDAEVDDDAACARDHRTRRRWTARCWGLRRAPAGIRAASAADPPRAPRPHRILRTRRSSPRARMPRASPWGAVVQCPCHRDRAARRRAARPRRATSSARSEGRSNRRSSAPRWRGAIPSSASCPRRNGRSPRRSPFASARGGRPAWRARS